MADESEENLSPAELLGQKHKKEKKELQAEILKLKHGVPKGDKKKKKEVTAQVALLEAELDQKHEKELKDLESTDVKVDEITEQLNLVSTAGGEENNVQTTTQTKKPSKAQKRREKKAAMDKEREDRIKEQAVENKSGSRHIEMKKLKEILGKRNLKIYEVPSDGNCLYTAVGHQLQQQGIQSSMEDLRKKTAAHMRANIDDFLPFLSNPDTGDLYTPEEYEKYCEDLETTPAWGGQHEIQALSIVLRLPIEVVQADAPSIVTGEEFQEKPVTLTYHRHMYGLGEHYNSVITKPADEDEEDGLS